MSSYEVEVEIGAAEQIQRLPRGDQTRIMAAITPLADEPRPDSRPKLTGVDSAYRVLVGVLRLVYIVNDGSQVVIVTRVANSREVHR